MRRIGTAGIDIEVVIRSAGLAWIDAARHREAGQHLGAIALRRYAIGRLGGERYADILQHGVLHGDFDALALAGAAAPVERRQNADGEQHTGAGIAERHAGLERRPVALAGNAHDATGRLRDHVEGEVVFVGPADAKALHLRVRISNWQWSVSGYLGTLSWLLKSESRLHADAHPTARDAVAAKGPSAFSEQII